MDYEKRNKEIFKVGIFGIIMNIFLFAIKLFAGTLSHSVSITADAFNNLTDTGSALITMIGAKISTKPADNEHPYGHGRFEYIASFLVALIVLNLAIEFFKNSIAKIIKPEVLETTTVTLAILAVSIIIKIVLGVINREKGIKLKSTSLKAVATDAFGDAVITSTVLVSIIIERITGYRIDGYMGLIVTIMIAMTGYNLVKEAVSILLGEAPDEKVVIKIKEELEKYPEIKGTHDLIIHNYGAGNILASIHVEVDADADIVAVHEVIDQAERDIHSRLGIHLVIHMDPTFKGGEDFENAKKYTYNIVEKNPDVEDMHDFRIVGRGNKKTLVFEVRVKPECSKTDDELNDDILETVRKDNPLYNIVVTFDRF